MGLELAHPLGAYQGVDGPINLTAKWVPKTVVRVFVASRIPDASRNWTPHISSKPGHRCVLSIFALPMGHRSTQEIGGAGQTAGFQWQGGWEPAQGKRESGVSSCTMRLALPMVGIAA